MARATIIAEVVALRSVADPFFLFERIFDIKKHLREKQTRNLHKAPFRGKYVTAGCSDGTATNCFRPKFNSP
jgi:hypothetical protein